MTPPPKKKEVNYQAGNLFVFKAKSSHGETSL